MGRSYIQFLRSNRDYRLIYLSFCISQIGDWFNLLALMAHLGIEGKSTATNLGLLFVVKQLPTLFASPFAGVVADRISRKQIMILSDLFRAIAVALLLLPAVNTSYSLILVVLILQTVGSAFFETARSAIIPDYVAKEDLPTTGALGSIAWSVMLVIGTALGGLATEFLGWRSAIILDILSYLISAGILLRLTHKSQVKIPAEKNFFLSDLKTLTTYLSEHPHVRTISLVKCLYGIAGGVVLVLTLFGERELQVAGSATLGVTALLVARGVGALLGPVAARYYTSVRRERMRNVITLSLVLGSASYMFLASANSVLLGAAAVFFAHFGLSITWVFSTVLLQIETKDEVRGRVFGFEMGMLTLTHSLSIMLYGPLIDLEILSLRTAAFVLGLTLLLPAAIWQYANTHWRE